MLVAGGSVGLLVYLGVVYLIVGVVCTLLVGFRGRSYVEWWNALKLVCNLVLLLGCVVGDGRLLIVCRIVS